jgi:methylated-DNA-[protein]-cysteine S-methyltransferase
VFYTHVDCPLGRLLLAGDIDRLELIAFPMGPGARGPLPDWQRFDAPFRRASAQLKEYFAGKRIAFDLALAPKVTEFQTRVLGALRHVPYGETRSYGEIAAAIGQPRATRAVGGAVAGNPLPIVIPCHRVVGTGGALTGFSGGIDAKRFLLDLERRHSGLFAAIPSR